MTTISADSLVMRFGNLRIGGTFVFTDGSTATGRLAAMDQDDATFFQLEGDATLYNLAQVVRIEQVAAA